MRARPSQATPRSNKRVRAIAPGFSSKRPLLAARLIFMRPVRIAALGAAALTVAGCGGSATYSPSAVPAPAPSSSTPFVGITENPGPAPFPSPSANRLHRPKHLIPDTAADRAVCREFGREQSGQQSADQFNVWLLQPQNGNPASGQLINSLSKWFISLAMNPPMTEGYVGEVLADCASIHVLF